MKSKLLVLPLLFLLGLIALSLAAPAEAAPGIMTVSYQVVGGGSPDAPSLNYTYLGVNLTIPLTTTPTPISVDLGLAWAVWPNPLSDSTSSERWTANQTLTGNATATTTSFTFYHQYYFTPFFSVGGLVSPVNGWRDALYSFQITATPSTGYAFKNWTGSGSGSYTGTSNPATATMNGPVNETALFDPQITVTSIPAGADFVKVDGSSIMTPHAYFWDYGSVHNLTANSPVSCGSGCRYVFASWSDGGTQAHNMTVPSTPTTYTAQYQGQYYLNVTAGPGGTAAPLSGWYNNGTVVQIQASPGAAFHSWVGSGKGNYTGTGNPSYVTMNGPISELARFSVQVTVTSDPAGTEAAKIDGLNATTPAAASWIIGSVHNLTATASFSCGSGCRYVFASWSDHGARSHNVTAPLAAATYAATFYKQYLITVAAGDGGTTDPAPGSYWRNLTSTFEVSAVPDSSHLFAQWTGLATETGNPVSLTVSSSGTVTATFIVHGVDWWVFVLALAAIVGLLVLGLRISGPAGIAAFLAAVALCGLSLLAIAAYNWAVNYYNGDVPAAITGDGATLIAFGFIFLMVISLLLLARGRSRGGESY